MNDDRAFLEKLENEFFSNSGNSQSGNQLVEILSVPTENTANSSLESNVVQGLVRSASGEKRKRSKKSSGNSSHSPVSITYRGLNIYHAAQQGNMPLCVLLWSMASAKRVNLIVPDANGNNPMHFAALSDTPEVS